MGGEGKGHGVRCLRRDGIELEWYSPLNLTITSTSFFENVSEPKQRKSSR